MKTLSAALQVSAQADAHTPAVRARLYNKRVNHFRPQYTTLYSGAEEDHYHAACFAGDGSLIRARIETDAPNFKCFTSRVASPGAGSDYTAWVDQGAVSIHSKVALCSYSSFVYLFALNIDGVTINYKWSIDNGATWSAWGTVVVCGATPGHLAATFRPGVEITLFYEIAGVVSAVQYAAGVWGAPAAWTNTLTNINGISAIYDNGSRIAIAGDSATSYGVWICTYDNAHAWSALLTVVTAASGSSIWYYYPTLAKPSTFMLYFMEYHLNPEIYSQVRWTAEIASSIFADNLWHEPIGFNSTKNSFTLIHNTGYVWLVRTNQVLRASTASGLTDVSSDVLNVDANTTPRGGTMAVELRNDAGQYNAHTFLVGAQLEIEFGYQVTTGSPYAAPSVYWIERLEHIREAHKSSFIIHAVDCWGILKRTQARYQYIWAGGVETIQDILQWLFARSGIVMSVVSASATMTGQKPPFTIYANESMANAINRLMQKVPDLFYFRGNTAFCFNPLAADASVYAYGVAHPITEARFISTAGDHNSIAVYGTAIITYDWNFTEAELVWERFSQVHDLTLTTAAQAHARGAAEERRNELESLAGVITVPLQPAQELYDVIDVTETLVALAASKRRIGGMKHRYNTRKGEYSLSIALCDV